MTTGLENVSSRTDCDVLMVAIGCINWFTGVTSARYTIGGCDICGCNVGRRLTPAWSSVAGSGEVNCGRGDGEAMGMGVGVIIGAAELMIGSSVGTSSGASC